MLQVLLIGYGAIGKAVTRHFAADPEIRISHIVVHSRAADADYGHVAKVLSSIDELSEKPDFALECAGHTAIREHVLLLLERGVDVGIVSIGSLAEEGMIERLEAAAAAGGAHLSILSGAIGGIDAIAAARFCGLEHVSYTGRKPPLGWKGTPAEEVVELEHLTEPVMIFRGYVREAARLSPKNANVAATISLAGLGLDRTEVTLIADPKITQNIHQIKASGAFGEMYLTLSGNPLPDNPRTSALTVSSAIRAIRNRSARLCI